MIVEQAMNHDSCERILIVILAIVLAIALSQHCIVSDRIVFVQTGDERRRTDVECARQDFDHHRQERMEARDTYFVPPGRRPRTKLCTM